MEVERPPLDEQALGAQVLLAHVVGKPRAWVLAHPQAALEPEQQSRLDALLQQLGAGTPLPYLTGRQEFYGLEFEVTPAVLIPRPETELLVERALFWLKSHPVEWAADVGTGSGCIAASVARHAPQARWIAVDRSRAALQVAQRNFARLGVSSQVRLIQGNLLSACAAAFGLVCANLPYIPSKTLETLPVARHEPLLALDGGEDGLDPIRELLAAAPRFLASGGALLIEMQFDQGEKIRRVGQDCLPGARIDIFPDLAGRPRLVEIVSA